jgi:HSP20 family protein
MAMRRTLFPIANSSLDNRTGQDVAFRDPFAALQTEMNRLFDDVWSGFGTPAANVQNAIAAPRVDVQEDDTNLFVQADLPGLSENDVEVTYDDGVLRIAGEKTAEQTDGKRQTHVTERAYGRFERQIPLGRQVNEDKIDASFKDGVLTITLPKAAEKETTKKINVKRAA